MAHYDMVIIGHISKDILKVKNEVSRSTGGAVYFAAFAAQRSGVGPLVVTKLAEEDFGLLDEMRQEGIEVEALVSPATTSIENSYESDDFDRRTAKLIRQAAPFVLRDLAKVNGSIYHLAGLFRGEIPYRLIEALSARGKVALDLQGVLRCNEQKSFRFRDWNEKEHYLPMITYLKADSLESEVITGKADRRLAATLLHGLGAKEVMITHSSEVILYDGGRLYSSPFTANNLSGRTGRGDTCFAACMSWRRTHGVEESLRYASFLTSIKMENPGPYRGSREEVYARMKSAEKRG